MEQICNDTIAAIMILGRLGETTNMPRHTHTHVEHDVTFFKTRNKYAVTFMDATEFNKWDKHT
jgi:hypothetical protein